MANPAPPATPTRKSVTGYVTKLVGDGATYGFINDEIFFQQTNVADGPASSGDRVFAECEYSELLPIKWNATSIRIISRAATGPASNILDSDPRRQSRQGLLNQQQPVQAPQTQSLPPANTYQQHRQQRQPQQHEIMINQPTVTTPMQPQQVPPTPVSAATMGLIDQANMNQQPDFFSPFAQPPPQLQDLQPFQIDTPMGPPKLEYTSQLGAAFVQNQFMSGPLMNQQPPPQPMLPQHQPQVQQQHQRQQQNHRDQKNSRDNNSAKSRFNDKNDRNQPNRGRNRTDKKYDQPRPTERENSANARSSRSSDSRDRSSGHGDLKSTKRDESSSTTSRQSPVSHTRSINTSSDRGHNTKHAPRRYYESQNIPKTSILTNLNGCNMRSRCSSSIHVPSDLKNVIVNAYLRLNIKNTPKPILFKIDQQDSAESEKAKSSSGDEIKMSENDPNATDTPGTVADNATSDDATSQSSLDNKTGEQITPPSSKSDTKLNHKYGVKVILISIPELESIYKTVFGPELDSYSNESRNQPKLDEAIALLCNKGANGGHSLIGGKFDPVLDGFVEGEANEFERFGKQPDLIATCRRVVQEQTGLDLGPCQGWTLVSTFLYNNKSDYFSTKSSVEYSFIYLPHIWSMMMDDLNDKPSEHESQSNDVAASTNLDADSRTKSAVASMTGTESKEIAKLEPELENSSNSEVQAQNETNMSTETNAIDTSIVETVNDQSLIAEVDEVSGNDMTNDHLNTNESANEAIKSDATRTVPLTIDNISDLKVVDLKLELDKRDIKYKPNAKKAELALALQMSLAPSCESSDQPLADQEVQNEQAGEHKEGSTEKPQLEEGEVATDDDNTNDADDSPKDDNVATEEPLEANKRKSDEMEGAEEQDPKKVCIDDQKKVEKVNLITKPFAVRARQGQLQLTTLSLNEAVQASRYDQFELSVASTIVKESLTQHLSEYIFTTLVEDSRQESKEAGENPNPSSMPNQQDATNNDTNNNSAATKLATTAAATNQTSIDKENLVKEYPVARYINLAFAYFDSAHMGYIQADDLFKLFNNTGLTISKRALWSLIGEGEKFNYRTLADLSIRFPPDYIYSFPDHFNRLPGSTVSQSESEVGSRMVEYQGVKYDVEKLIQQVREAEINRVNMVQRFNDAISKHDQQVAEIHVLEVSQNSLSKSIKALNAEVSDLKKEKANVEKRVESLKKQIKEAIKTLSES